MMSEQERRHWLILAIASAIFAVDQTTKWYWVGVTNDGYASGLWSSGRLQTIILAVIILAVLTYFLIRWRVPWWAACLVIVGCISNIWDRVAYGAVRDFIPTGNWRWNLADLALYSGLIAVAVFLIHQRREGVTHADQAGRPTRTGRASRHRRGCGRGAQVSPQVPVRNAEMKSSSGRGFHPLRTDDPSSPRPVDEYEEDETEEN